MTNWDTEDNVETNRLLMSLLQASFVVKALLSHFCCFVTLSVVAVTFALNAVVFVVVFVVVVVVVVVN